MGVVKLAYSHYLTRSRDQNPHQGFWTDSVNKRTIRKINLVVKKEGDCLKQRLFDIISAFGQPTTNHSTSVHHRLRSNLIYISFFTTSVWKKWLRFGKT